jgi:hypothetical protein
MSHLCDVESRPGDTLNCHQVVTLASNTGARDNPWTVYHLRYEIKLGLERWHLRSSLCFLASAVCFDYVQFAFGAVPAVGRFAPAVGLTNLCKPPKPICSLNKYRPLLHVKHLSPSVCAVCGLPKHEEEIPNPVKFDTYHHTILVLNIPSNVPRPIPDVPLLPNISLYQDRIVNDSNSHIPILLCPSCHLSLKRHRLPSTAIPNHLYFHPGPPCLCYLTLIQALRLCASDLLSAHFNRPVLTS